LFKNFFSRTGLPNRMRKTDYHTLTPFVAAAAIDDEVRVNLDQVVATARLAKPRSN
jgi:hypothetical protein